jgi:Zn-dependent protease
MMILAELLGLTEISPSIPILFILAIIISLTVHEFMHAYSAKQFGDSTAEMLGRVSLNPVRHIDPFGAVVFLLMGFGWAKPVPTNPYNYKSVSPKIGYGLVALAGPVSNIVLALASALVLSLLLNSVAGSADVSYQLFAFDLNAIFTELNPFVANSIVFLNLMIFVNTLTFAFNMIPLPPLDGSKILQSLTLNRRSVKFWESMEEYGPLILFGLIFIGILTSGVFNPLIIFVDIFRTPINFLVSLILQF